MKIILTKPIEIRGVKKKEGLIMEGTVDFCNQLINSKKARSLTDYEEQAIRTKRLIEESDAQKNEARRKIEEEKQRLFLEEQARKELEQEEKPKKKPTKKKK